MPYALKRLKPRHYRIVDMVLAGKSRIKIALAVGMTPRAISMVTGSQVFQREVAARREEMNRKQDQTAAETMNRASVLAAQKMVELLDHPNPRIAQASANAILNFALGKGGPQPSQVPTIYIDPAAAEWMKNTLKESQEYDRQTGQKLLPGWRGS
jgi:uncharacterized protein with beta-barrel porin domain